MEDVICKAEMKPKFFKFFPFIIIALIVVFSIPVHTEYNPYADICFYHNILDDFICASSSDEIFILKYFTYFGHLVFSFLSWSIALPTWLLIFWIINTFIVKYNVKHSSLCLAKDEISENRKRCYSNKLVKIPIEKIGSISVENRIIDKLLGGQSIAIRSTSGLVRFICVQNAEEFVNKTLEAIKAYKESSKSVTEDVQKNSGDDSLEKITKLKEMLDNGIITQEEFDTKKKQLLGL